LGLWPHNLVAAVFFLGSGSSSWGKHRARVNARAGLAAPWPMDHLETDFNLIDLTRFKLVIAQAAEGAPQGSPLGLLPAVVVIVVLFYFLMIRPERKKQATHKTLLENLKKNDRVVTIGGIYGVVMNVQRDSDEVTLKIDEATNTKIRVTFGAIARVLGEDASGEKSA
jgi:preprotein translocase subunit YajC